MIVLVTAANSHLGSMLVKGLIEEGHEVHAGVKDPVTDGEELAVKWPNVKIFPIRFPEAPPADAAAAPKKGEMDLEVLDGDIRRALKDVDWVFHSAGIQSFDLHTEIMLTIFQACKETPSVKKVVITSPINLIRNGSPSSDKKELTEDDWNSSSFEEKRTNVVTKYLEASLSAEKAAWDFMKTKVANEFSLSVMHGGNVVGPVCLRNHAKGSLHFAMTRRILIGLNSHVEHQLHLVDIRDCVAAWIRAAEYKEAANKRFILVAKTMSNKEVTEILKKEFQPLGFKNIRVSTFTMPNWFSRYVLAPMCAFMPLASYAFSRAGKDVSYDASRSREILKIQYRDVEKSLIEGTHSMIEHGVIDKSTMPKKRDDCMKQFNWIYDR